MRKKPSRWGKASGYGRPGGGQSKPARPKQHHQQPKLVETAAELIRKMRAGESKLLVVSRVRPLSEDEKKTNASEVACVVGQNMVVLMDPNDNGKDVLRLHRSREKRYAFDRAYGTTSSQNEVYEGSCKFLLPGILEGYNGTVFAYGPTGAGKTHTMVGNDQQPGVMVQAISDLFTLVGQETDPDIKHKVQVSYIEIYNECLRDLLVSDTPDLELREDAEGNSVVCGVQRTTIETSAEMMKLLKDGNRRRTQEATFANLASSRSHAVLEVTVDRWSTVPGTTTAVQSGRLFMIDLAGSERAQASGNNGQRMVEGQHINRSLLALGNCINALGGGQKSNYVNYRDSKLTRMLKDSLSGNCRTVMIACASPASIHFEETYNTMNYANRAKNIKTKVAKNVTVVEAHVAQYVEMIANLREQVTSLKGQLSAEGLAPAPPSNMLALASPTGALFDSIDAALEQQRLTRVRLAKLSGNGANNEGDGDGDGDGEGGGGGGGGAAAAADEPLEVVQQRIELTAQLKKQTATVQRLIARANDHVSAPGDQRMLQLIERNGALETQHFDLGNSLGSSIVSFGGNSSMTHNRFSNSNSNNNSNISNSNDAEGLALRDRIIEAQRLQLKKLGKRKAAAPPELARMYTELEALRLVEGRPLMAALPSIQPGFGERTRPVVGSAAVMSFSAEEEEEDVQQQKDAEEEEEEEETGSDDAALPPSPPQSGGRGVFGMFGRGKKRLQKQQQQQQAALPAIIPDSSGKATSPRLLRRSASPKAQPQTSPQAGDEKKQTTALLLPTPSPSSRRRSPFPSPAAAAAAAATATTIPNPSSKASPASSSSSSSSSSTPHSLLHSPTTTSTTPSTSTSATSASAAAAAAATAAATATLASSGTIARMLPRSRSSTVLEIRPGSSDDDSDSASEIASDDDEDTAAAMMEAWSNDGRSLAGSLGGSLASSARRHTATAGSAGSSSIAANDPLNNTYTKTRPMPSSKPTNNTTISTPAAAAGVVHGRRALRGGSPKGLASLDSSPVPSAVSSARSSPTTSIAGSPVSTTVGNKRSSPTTKHGSTSPRVGRRGGGGGGGGGGGSMSPYKTTGPHASTSPLRVAGSQKSPGQRSPRGGGGGGGGGGGTNSSLAPVQIPRGRVQTSPIKASGRPHVKLTSTTSPVKRVTSKVKGRAPMAGGTGLFDLSIQASPYGVQTRQPRGIRYA